jgi:hypothetical protein
MTGAAWQDVIAALAALAAGAWLFRRWLVRRRTKVGCDTCAASMHARLQNRPGTPRSAGTPKTPAR